MAFFLILGSCGSVALDNEAPVMTAAQAIERPQPGADHRLFYGPAPLHFGDLWLPDGEGPHPVVAVLHGGCWLAAYDLGYMAGFSAALAERGFAVWSMEYRRVGNEGGGWPGTFTDVGAGIDHLRQLAADYNLDPGRVALVGHSAGGHLALWASGRGGLAPTDPIRGDDPLPVRGVVSLAGIPDLGTYVRAEGCGASIPDLIGGHPSTVTDRLARTSPSAMLPLNTRQILISGNRDDIVPPIHAERHVQVAIEAGDPAEAILVEGAGHFELTTPHSVAWVEVVQALESLLD